MEREADDLTEAATDEALGDEPRADELRSMAQVLLDRFARFKDEFDDESDPAKRERLKKEMLKLREQISVLSEEAEITQFVQDAVKLGVRMREVGD